METISNVATSASKLIWGEQNQATNKAAGEEPVSGVQGKGTTEEPFDQGNAETPIESTGKSDIDKPIPSSTSDPEPSISHKPTVPETMNTANATTGGTPNPLENTEGTGVTGASAQKYAPKGSDIVPSESSDNPGAAPESGAAPSQKQQGADRPTDEPTEDPDEILKKRDPNDHSGEPMKMHDGSETIPATQAERRDSKAGMPGGQEHGEEPKGTGEQWVKTSGLHADGGDFDATKPGAGREADRLLEAKGIHKDESGVMDNPSAASSGTDTAKVSKLDKLKDKLHIGHHKAK